ncbi:Maintenance of mitochondrial morphology protein 1 [Frankliniella fusca]|uniref:Maintenance of mitochondrial morphology protein 1 n=1 Tax=Frankliniella fusca TaxID=407009 RepID=A0AAE1HEX5_9NEOP|nr:Maintenance of mitochondrial morphology protein 1 [Frankliniella fusca]
MTPGMIEMVEPPATPAPAPADDAQPAAPHLDLLSTTRNSVTLVWGPAALGLHRGGPGRMTSTASQDSGPTGTQPGPGPGPGPGGQVPPPSPRPLSGLGQRSPRPAPAPTLSVESQGSVFDTDDRPDYRLQIREREKPWQTIYW